MTTNLGQLAELVGARVQGDETTIIRGAAILRDAGPGDVTLVEDAAYVSRLVDSCAAAVVIPPSIQATGRPLLIVDDVRSAFSKIILHFRPARARVHTGISPAASIGPTTKLGKEVVVYPNATIGDDVTLGDGSVIGAGVHIMDGCQIGDNVQIFSNTVLYEDTIVGSRTTIHSNASIGAYGFGYDTVDGQHVLGYQLGYVSIGRNVEIGANTSIDRGTYGPTVIGDGTKIDDQVMIAHNCRIGRHNFICSQVGLAGSASTGDYVIIAGQAGIKDHIHVDDRGIVMAMAGVMNDVPAGEVFFGYRAQPVKQSMRAMAIYEKLPEMQRKLRQLESEVARLGEGEVGHQDAA